MGELRWAGTLRRGAPLSLISAKNALCDVLCRGASGLGIVDVDPSFSGSVSVRLQDRYSTGSTSQLRSIKYR